jgi:hypothetical protein
MTTATAPQLEQVGDQLCCCRRKDHRAVSRLKLATLETTTRSFQKQARDWPCPLRHELVAQGVESGVGATPPGWTETKSSDVRGFFRALFRTRTGDPLFTMFRGVTRGHARSLAACFLLQMGIIRRRGVRREMSRVSVLMCPFCVRDPLTR